VTAFGKRIFDDKLGVPWLSKGVKALADTSLSSYTRAQEEEADRIGFQYFVAAGYDPREAPRSFAALIEVEAQKKSIFDVFDGYPEGIKRAEAINDLVFTGAMATERHLAPDEQHRPATFAWHKPTGNSRPHWPHPASSGSSGLAGVVVCQTAHRFLTILLS
jgi:hypothetical protein